MPESALFATHAAPEAIRAELREARESVRVAKKKVHALECLLERREMEIADGTWPPKSRCTCGRLISDPCPECK